MGGVMGTGTMMMPGMIGTAGTGRTRTPMTPGHYTSLFFLDEATALAAGHRPCAECQRERFTAFRAQWAAANPELAGGAPPLVKEMLDLLRGLGTEHPCVSRYRGSWAHD